MALPKVEDALSHPRFSWISHTVWNFVVALWIVSFVLISELYLFITELTANEINQLDPTIGALPANVALIFLVLPAVLVLFWDQRAHAALGAALKNHQSAIDNQRGEEEVRAKADKGSSGDSAKLDSMITILENCQRAEFRDTFIILRRQLLIFVAPVLLWVLALFALFFMLPTSDQDAQSIARGAQSQAAPQTREDAMLRSSPLAPQKPSSRRNETVSETVPKSPLILTGLAFLVGKFVLFVAFFRQNLAARRVRLGLFAQELPSITRRHASISKFRWQAMVSTSAAA